MKGSDFFTKKKLEDKSRRFEATYACSNHGERSEAESNVKESVKFHCSVLLFIEI